MSATIGDGDETGHAGSEWLPGSVAIVHDYLNQRGGAERVALELARIWPRAPLYTSLYRPQSTFLEFSEFEVKTTSLDRLPVDRRFRALAPLLPLAFRSIGVLEHELVISSSSGWAHGVRTAPESVHVVYCHNPARWLYASRVYLRGGPRLVASPLLRPLRRWDRAAAHRADAYIANSELTRRRIGASYGIEAEVVHPPVDVGRLTPRPRGERLLVVSRLLPYKRVDLVVKAARRTGIGLDVVGDGPELARLRAIGGSGTSFHGKVEEAQLKQLLESCRAVCVPGAEDFGIVPVEALAAGKPVVAFAAGGVLETLEDGVSGTFFAHQRVDALVEAIRRCDELGTDPHFLARLAQRFSAQSFRANLLAAVGRAHTRKLDHELIASK